jgi:hypothetical protein
MGKDEHALDPRVKPAPAYILAVPSGWFPDPLGAADLRWFDGTTWTWHVATAGRAWTAPYGDVVARPPDGEPAGGRLGQGGAAPPPPGSGRDPLAVDELVVSRPAQPRSSGAWLDVYDGDGTLGRFVETTPDELHGASVVRLTDALGAPVLTVVHPGGSGRARVDGPNGPCGFVSRVGRLRSNLELHAGTSRPEGEPLAVLRPVEAGDGWEWPLDGERGSIVRLRWWRLSAPTAATYGEARYTLQVGADAAVDPALRPLLVALAVLVDHTVVQAVTA